MLLVDTNVLVDVLEGDPEWADWSIGQLRAQSRVHCLAINPVIHAAVSGYSLLTCDTGRSASYFPGVDLIVPKFGE